MRMVMKICRFYPASAFLIMVAGLLCGQQLMAQQIPRVSSKVSPQRDSASTFRSKNSLPQNLYPLQASFTQGYPTPGANADGTDLWPCDGSSSTPNPDCPTVGDPAITLPATANVTGSPALVWQLKNTAGSGNGYGCNALTNGTGHLGVPYISCGQIETWYEDDTNDATDELLYSAVVTQGTRTIFDTGTVDLGPNVYAAQNPPSDVNIYDDANFGFGPGDGPGTGPNNGNCSPDYNYPLTSPANPGETYLVAAGKICVTPLPGMATITVTTELGSPSYTQVTGSACTSMGVSSPCYTVKWTRKYPIKQQWNIWLE